MSSYKQIDNETLLVERADPAPEIHYSFYDSHVMNFVENDTGYSGDTPAEKIKNYVGAINKRRDKIQVELEKTPLFKYIDIRSLAFWFKANRLFWDRVSDSWEDPFENYFLKENFVLPDRTPIDAKNNIPGVFGQSWTTREETDAMWRIYSKEEKTGGVNNSRILYGVRIGTTARKLLNVIYTDDSSMAKTWIGKVRYMSEAEINQTLSGGVRVINDALADSFFNKRNEFDHEHEFRAMILLDSNSINKTSSYKRIAFDVLDMEDFIESYVLDPRLTCENYDFLRNQLIKMGVNPLKIKQSSLYQFTPVEVTMH